MATTKPPRAGTPLRIRVRVTPRAGSDAIVGWAADASSGRVLRARVRAAPADGAANEALVRLLAKKLRLPARAVRVVTGASARTKLVEVDGVTQEQMSALG